MPSIASKLLRGKATLGILGAFAKLSGGDVSERPKVQLSKSCVGESPPWVQIPPSPPAKLGPFRAFSILWIG
ncbi:MAG: hypothetical protein RLZZ579_730 [Actinomycetota bacterium]